MPKWPQTCSCDRCFKLGPDSDWQDSEHSDSDAPLNFCPQCGQQLEEHPSYNAKLDKGPTHAY